MKWIKKHVNSDYYGSYDKKYGNDEYWAWQIKMFEHPDIITGLTELIKVVKNPKHILNIGINNAYELEVIKHLPECTWEWKSIQLTGVDLSISAIIPAEERLQKLGVKYELINADIVEINSLNGPFDLCMGITSLQSAVIYDLNFRKVMDKLVGFMKPTSTFFIVAPNCSIENDIITSGGAYNVRLGKQDPFFAKHFIEECSVALSENGFSNTILGEDFISLISNKT